MMRVGEILQKGKYFVSCNQKNKLLTIKTALPIEEFLLLNN